MTASSPTARLENKTGTASVLNVGVSFLSVLMLILDGAAVVIVAVVII